MLNQTNDRLLFARSSSKMKALLRSVKAFISMTFVEGEKVSIAPSTVWQTINKIGAASSKEIERNAPNYQVTRWLTDCSQPFGNECYLVIGGFGLPWAKVRFSNKSEWLLELWEILESKDFVIMSMHQTVIVGFIEDEHFYEAHVLNVDDLASAAP
jgi:hypothetical protein